MSEGKKGQQVRSVRVYLPDDVADYYDQLAKGYNTSLSAAASPVLCAMARGEIRNEFTRQPGTDTRPQQ